MKDAKISIISNVNLNLGNQDMPHNSAFQPPGIDKESGRDTWIKEYSMETDKFSAKYSDADQLKKYAAEQIALSHHEKWNGQGYPNGLSGKDIPLTGRIVAIADVFDALTSKRPYKKIFSLETAINIMKKERGQHFDPDVLDIFLANIDEVVKIMDSVKKEKFSLLEYLWNESN